MKLDLACWLPALCIQHSWDYQNMDLGGEGLVGGEGPVVAAVVAAPCPWLACGEGEVVAEVDEGGDDDVVPWGGLVSSVQDADPSWDAGNLACLVCRVAVSGQAQNQATLEDKLPSSVKASC